MWVAVRTDFWVGLITATVVCTAIGALLRLALRRTGPIYFAMGTIAFGGLVTILFQNWTGFTGGYAGEGSIPIPSIFGYQLQSLASQYDLLIVAMGVILVGTALVEQSPGRDLTFARDLGPVAITAGLRPDRLKMIAFAVGCGIQGAAGSLFAHTTTYLSLDSFSMQVSLNVLLMILLGGIGSMYGPLLGALVIVEIPEVLRFIQSYATLVYACLVLVAIVPLPLGLAGARHPGARPVRRQPAHAARRPLDREVVLMTTAASETMLEATGVAVSFGAVKAVDGVDLSVAPGEVLGIIGPNGSGKSTFLNAVTGLVPAKGTVKINGAMVHTGRPEAVSRLGVRRTFQTPQVHDGLTCLENVLVGLPDRTRRSVPDAWFRRPGMWRQERDRWTAARDALRFVGIEHLAHTQAGALSYGQRRMLEIARAKAGEPRVLLMEAGRRPEPGRDGRTARPAAQAGDGLKQPRRSRAQDGLPAEPVYPASRA